MNLGVSSYITSAGLRAVTSGGALGPYFALKYFIPFYDYRLDKTICRELTGSTSAKSISSLNYVSATHSTLFGEKLYANGNYSLSNNKFIYWTSNMGSLTQGGTNTNIASQQSVSTDVNLESSKPISVVVSGSTVVPSPPGNFTITNTDTISGVSRLSTFNPLTATAWPLSAFYPVVSYSPNANGITSATGTYKCRIPPANGSFKFNGLAIYATKVDNNGFDDSGNGISFFNFNPTLFAVILFDQSQYKQPTPGGVNDFEISVDLSFDWSVVNPGASAVPVYVNTNYWNKLPISTTTSANGLNYDGDIVISNSAVPESWTPRAKLTVTDPMKQQLRLANDNIRFSDFRTLRFPIRSGLTAPAYDDRAVLAIDTSCPDDSLMQLGYKTSALGIKSLAIGCYSSATGYYNNGNFINENFGDSTPVPNSLSDVRGYSGGYTVSIGVGTLSQGFASWAIGYNTSAIGYLNFAGGDNSLASYNNYNPGALYTDNSPSNGLNFAYGKYTSAISRSSDNQYCDYVSYISDADDESYGSNLSFGVRNLSNGGLSLSFGNSVSSFGMGSIGFGYRNLSNGCFSFVHGVDSIANNTMSFAYGYKVSALSNFGVGIGDNILVGSIGEGFGLGIGQGVSATNTNSIGIGQGVISQGLNSVAIGKGDVGNTYQTTMNINSPLFAGGHSSFSLGYASSAISDFNIAFGKYAYSNGGQFTCVSIGENVSAISPYSFALGYKNKSYAQGAFTLNENNIAGGKDSLAFGYGSSALGFYSVAGGLNSLTTDAVSFAFGDTAKATKLGSIALGSLSEASNVNSIAIGYNSKTDGDSQVVIGSCDTDTRIRGNNIIIGDGCNSNVIFQGVDQLNDSIAFDIKIISTDISLINDPHTESVKPRKILITLIRNNKKTSVELEETDVFSGFLKLNSIIGSTSLYVYSSNLSKYYSVLNVGTSNIVLDCNKFDAPSSINNNSITSYNLFVYYDKSLDSMIFYIYGANSTGLVEATGYSYDFDTNYVYAGQLAPDNYKTDYHILQWNKNFNHIDVSVDYDKHKSDNVVVLKTNAKDGNGVCSYNIFNKTKGERVITRIEGLDNYYSMGYSYDYNTPQSKPSKAYTIEPNDYSGPFLSSRKANSSSGPVNQTMTGIFINSNGYSISTTPTVGP